MFQLTSTNWKRMPQPREPVTSPALFHCCVLFSALWDAQSTLDAQRGPSALLSLCIQDVNLIHNAIAVMSRRMFDQMTAFLWLDQADMWSSPSQCNSQGKGGLSFRGLQLQFSIALFYSLHIISYVTWSFIHSINTSLDTTCKALHWVLEYY